jgi:hypothetical protein
VGRISSASGEDPDMIRNRHPIHQFAPTHLGPRKAVATLRTAIIVSIRSLRVENLSYVHPLCASLFSQKDHPTQATACTTAYRSDN